MLPLYFCPFWPHCQQASLNWANWKVFHHQINWHGRWICLSTATLTWNKPITSEQTWWHKTLTPHRPRPQTHVYNRCTGIYWTAAPHKTQRPGGEETFIHLISPVWLKRLKIFKKIKEEWSQERFFKCSIIVKFQEGGRYRVQISLSMDIYLMNVVSCMFQNLSQVGQTKVGHFMHVRVHMDFKWPTYKEYCKKYQVYETFYHTLLGQD